MSVLTYHTPFEDKSLKVEFVSWGETMGAPAGAQVQITHGYGREQKIIAVSLKDARPMAEMLKDYSGRDSS